MSFLTDIIGILGLTSIFIFIKNYFWYVAGIFIFIVVSSFILIRNHNKSKYPFTVRIRRRRANGYYVEFITTGGMTKINKHVQRFRIKLDKWRTWKYIDIDNTPDTDLIYDGSVVYYEQVSPVDFVQLKIIQVPRTIEKKLQEYNLSELEKNEQFTFNKIKEGNGEYFYNYEGRRFILRENKEHVDLVELFEIKDIQFEPINLQKKSLILARLQADVNDPLAEKKGLLAQIIPYLGIIFFAVACLIVFYAIKP